MFEFSKEREELLNSQGNLLVLGGPGSGKTTVALLKAKHAIEFQGIKRGQKVLFLSFARATVSRVEEQIVSLLTKEVKKHLEVNTYHGFIWNLLRCHGYLLNSKMPIRLLPPPEAASKFATIRGEELRGKEKYRLFEEECILHFDLFAHYGGELLKRSNALARIISDSYPIIVLDEFQDTNVDEWGFIQAIGKRSTLIALADAEQRIYEFRGADPARIGEFITCFNPKQFDFGIENNRSKGTDILEFGNDLLTDKNRGKIYKNVQISPYPFRQGYGSHFDLKLSVFKTRKKLLESGLKNWSIAVLVPSKKLMLEVSDFLNAIQVLPNNRKFPAIKHEVALESAGPSLAGILIAGLLDSGSKKQIEISALINNLCEHARGRNGSDVPSQAIIELTEALSAYVSSGKIRGTKRQTIINECKSTMIKCNELNFTGNPLEDWITVQNIINENTSEIFKKVFVDSKYLRLLHKSSELRASFGNLWRIHGNYNGAVQAIKTALLQEYFSSSSKLWTGINVMTIHKSKGKEFDEVIIYEGRFHGKIISNIEDEKKLNQSRLNLRVAATRAKDNVTIITPNNDICFFLKG